MMRSHLLLLLVGIISCASLSQAYPTGAPPFACSGLDPSTGHGPSTNQGPSPFNLTFSEDEYTPGQSMEVTLSGANGQTFMGFLILASAASGGSTVPVGAIAVPNNAVYQSRCTSQGGNGVTHKDNTLKSSITFQWTPPSGATQDIVFHFTVVRGATGAADYFKDLKSSVLRAVKPSLQKDPECGKTKGCIGNCKPDNSCDMLATWQPEGTSKVRLTIQSLFTSDNTYVALGFSEEAKMFKASVVTCRVFNGKVDVIGSTNAGYANTPLTNVTEGLSGIQGSSNNGLLSCTFLREKTSSDPDIFDLDQPWHLIMAKGALNAGGVIQYHGEPNRHVTPDKVQLPDIVDLNFGGDVTTTSPSPNQPTTSTKGSRFPKDPECGKTKGCYSNCDSDGTCDWLISWLGVDNTTVQIGMMSTFTSDGKYVAMGFSTRAGMFDASVVSCRLQQDKVNAIASYNPGHYNTPLPNVGVDLTHGTYQSGVLSCTIQRDVVTHNPQVFNLTESWYLITARGSLDPANGNLEYHGGTDRHDTVDKIDFLNSVIDLSFAPSGMSTSPTTPPAPAKQFQKDPTCGQSAGCWSNCANDLCDFLVSWRKQGEDYVISLKSGFDSDDNNYVALGFSQAEKMYPASVVQCIGFEGKQAASLSYNGGHTNQLLPPDDQKIVKQISGSYQDGVLTCTMSRPIKHNDSRVYDLDNQWYLISARGGVSGGVITPHTGPNRFMTSSRVDLSDTSVDISMKSSTYPLIKAHGCLMVLAWILSASIGIGMARYFKPVWPDTLVSGVKIWFAIHRTAMVLTFLMGVAAFVTIFVQVEGYSEIIGEDYKKAHPILGIIVTGLLVINPFMSLLRCAPDHPQRPIFNWAHFIVGTSAHILSAVTIAMGLYLPKAQTDGKTGLIILIVYGSWQVLFFCIMSAIDFIAKNDISSNVVHPSNGHNGTTVSVASREISLHSDSGENNFTDVNTVNPAYDSVESVSSQQKPKSSTGKQWVLGFHIVVVTTVAVYLMYMIIDTNV